MSVHHVNDGCDPPHTPQELMKSLEPHWEKSMRKQGLLPPTRHNEKPELVMQRKEVIPWLTEHGISFMELVVKPSTFFDPKRGKLVMVESPMRGWPDLILIIKGRFVGVELKIKSVQSDNQKMAQEIIEKGGGIYALVHSVAELERLVNPLLT